MANGDKPTPEEKREMRDKLFQESMQDNYVKSLGEFDREQSEWDAYKKQYGYAPTAGDTDLASRDTPDQLAEYNRLGVNWKFDSKFNQDQLSDKQGMWEKAGNAGSRFLWNTLYDTIGGTGAMFDLGDYFNQDDEVGNWLSNWATEQKNKANANAPIHRRVNDAAFGQIGRAHV